MRFLISILLLLGSLHAAEHPHLLFSSSEIPGLKQKIRNGGVPERAYRLLLKRCEAHKKLVSVSTAIRKGQLSDKQPDALSELALAWLLSGDRSFAEALERLVAGAREKKVNLAQCGCQVPLIFDWGYDVLSEPSRKYLKELILSELKQNPKMSRYPFHAIYGNWGYFMYQPYAIRFLAVLSGHPEFDRKALERAAEALKITLNHAITADGAVTEHGAYTNYPFDINGSAVFILERKGFRLSGTTHLRNIGNWLAMETTAADPPRYFPLGDCNQQEPSLFMLRLLRRLYPDSGVLCEMLRRCGGESERNPDPISGIIYHMPLPASPSDRKTGPATCFYPEMNLLLYRSDRTENAFQFAAEAIVGRGHSHSDVGSFVLYAGGVNRVTDPGYGIQSGTSHNIVTIDGTAPDAHGGPGHVDAQLTGDFAVAVTIDAFDAWNSKVLYALRTQATPRVLYANRTMAILQPDRANRIPPYLLITDSIRGLKESGTYEFRLQQEAFTSFRLEKDAARIEHHTSSPAVLGRWEGELEIPAAEKYNLYLLAAGKSNLQVSINGKKVSRTWFSSALPYRFAWRKIAGRIPLGAGKHKIALHADEELKGVWICASKLEEKLFGSPFEPPPPYASLHGKSAATQVWIPVPADLKMKILDVPAPKVFQSHRTLLAESRKGNFAAVILPETPETRLPKCRTLGNWYGFTHVLEWEQASDFFAVSGSEPAAPSGPLPPRLKMVRVPRSALRTFPKVIPESLQWLAACGGSLKIGSHVIFEAKEAGGDQQMITYPRVAIQGWAVCDGTALRVELRCERRSGAFPRPIALRAFAPRALAVYCNEKKVAFERKGKYIFFTAMPEKPRLPEEERMRAYSRFAETFSSGEGE